MSVHGESQRVGAEASLGDVVSGHDIEYAAVMAIT